MNTEFLLFQLYGPMASWGEIAVGEERDSSARPSRSAILGLCAAALGIPRTEEERLLGFNKSMGFAVCVDEPGDILRDFHSVQSPSGKNARDLPTRRDELAYSNVKAILSSRHYRTDAYYTICLWARHKDGPVTLSALAKALNQPEFTLFLGRKSCPLAIPLNPRLIEAPSIREAINAYPVDPNLRWLSNSSRRRNADSMRSIFWDADTQGIEPGCDAVHHAKRWDKLISRQRWQFARRDEAFARINRTSAPEER